MSTTKSQTKSKRPHSGKLGKKQLEFIYNLRGRHTMRIKADFKKQYGYDITSGRIKSAINTYESKYLLNNQATSNSNDIQVMILRNGTLYTLDEFRSAVENDARDGVINQIKSIYG